MSEMMFTVVRRLTGFAIVLFAIAYWGGMYIGYNLPKFDLPSWFHSPAFWGGMVVLAVWAWLPVLAPVGNKEVSLAQEMPRQFQSPEQVQNQPFEMNGMWCIIWNGQYMVWDEQTNQWTPYRGN